MKECSDSHLNVPEHVLDSLKLDCHALIPFKIQMLIVRELEKGNNIPFVFL